MSAGEKILGVGLLGLLIGVVVATEIASTPERLPAPEEPKRLPKPTARPPARRVYQWRRSIVDEFGIEHVAHSYAPTEPDEITPWAVTGWYDATRDAEVIRVDFAPGIPFEDLKFAVRWGEELKPDRSSFRTNAPQLWPDDKWNDRVVYRYRESEATGCFLVEVTVGDATIDFYHESERPVHLQTAAKLLALAELPPEPAAQALEDFKKYQSELTAIRLQRAELEAAALHPDDKKALGNFLDQRTREASATHLSRHNSIDFFSPRR